MHAALVFVQLAFAGFHVIGKAVLGHMEPMALAGYRVLLATPIVFLLAWRLEHFRPAKRDLPVLAVLGLLGVFLNQMLFITGLRHTTATNAGIIMPSIPVFTAAIAAAFGVERLSWRQGLGIGVAVFGAAVMLNPLQFQVGSGLLLGNLLLLLNALAYAGYLVLQRPVLRRVPPLTLTAWAFMFGSLGVLAVSAPAMARVPFADEPRLVWWGLAYIVLIPTALNYALNTWAVGRSSPSTAAAYIPLQPAGAGVLAAIFLGEEAGWREGLGFALIITGLILVSQGLRRNGRGKAAT